MEYGPEILRSVNALQSDVGDLKGNVGGLSAEVDALRRDFDRARDESSDRYDKAVGTLEERLKGLSESSDARSADLSAEIAKLREEVHGQAELGPPDALARMVQEDEALERDKEAKRGLLKGITSALKGLGALFIAIAGAVSAWWATHKG